MKIKIISVALLLCLSCIHGYGVDSMEIMMKKADKAYQSGDYASAARDYNVLLEFLERQKTKSPETVSFVRYRLARV